jgi:uncharacterized Zn finger protein
MHPFLILLIVLAIALVLTLIVIGRKVLWCPKCGKFRPMEGWSYPVVRFETPKYASNTYSMDCRYCGHKWEQVYKVDKEKFDRYDW